MNKIAAVHTHTIMGDIDYNLKETIKILKILNTKNVNFALFPELALSGYIKNNQLLKSIVNRRDEIFKPLLDLSKSISTAFAIGFPQEQNGLFYISQTLIYKGKIIGTHKKTHLSPSEKNVFSEGNIIKSFEIDNIGIAMQLCFESHFPEITYAQAKMGANIISIAFASPGETANEKLNRFKKFLCARAYDNACYVVACNYSGETQNGILCPGLSIIINPKGVVLSESVQKKTNYCIAEFNKKNIDKIHQSKMAWFNKYKKENMFKDFYTETLMHRDTQ